jgi:hypothetical protein
MVWSPAAAAAAAAAAAHLGRSVGGRGVLADDLLLHGHGFRRVIHTGTGTEQQQHTPGAGGGVAAAAGLQQHQQHYYQFTSAILPPYKASPDVTSC